MDVHDDAAITSARVTADEREDDVAALEDLLGLDAEVGRRLGPEVEGALDFGDTRHTLASAVPWGRAARVRMEQREKAVLSPA